MNLEELQAICDAATPGPWAPEITTKTDGSAERYACRGPFVPGASIDQEAQAKADGAFLMAAREHMPALVKAARSRELDAAAHNTHKAKAEPEEKAHGEESEEEDSEETKVVTGKGIIKKATKGHR